MPEVRGNVYALYKDGKLIAKGMGKELGKLLNIDSEEVGSYARRGVPKDDYTIKKIGKIKGNEFQADEEPDEFQFLYTHLNIYGNTSINNNPEQYVKELEKRLNGKITVYKRVENEDPFNYEPETFDPKKMVRRKKEIHYYIELKRRK